MGTLIRYYTATITRVSDYTTNCHTAHCFLDHTQQRSIVVIVLTPQNK